ncbi:TraC family protein [Neorhizobium sp. T786]|uniref:TraC family protein n=1 Tax=Pseudorhizobium xiangyangii TaxID=2883104 RepID=UPI001D000C4F|nr:TraC family protein [Neorhizobium xiangyangii]MCB5205581.1 TraC family protein [Neorhizobium xiangyangii]
MAPRSSKSIADLEAEISKIRDKIKARKEQGVSRIGKLAMEAGLHNLDISDDQFREAFAKLTEQFRKSAT